MGRTLLVDGNNLVHRFHDVYADARTPFGLYNGGLYGLIQGVRKFMAANHDHDSVVYVVDKGVPEWRRLLCPEYKGQRAGNRKTEEEVLHYERYKEQVRHTRHVVRHTGCAFAWAPGWEGDDVIGALAHRRLADRGVTILSTDNDYIELVDGDRVRMYQPITNLWVPPQPFYVMERCIDPKESDNLDGARGVGEVGAAGAIQLWLRHRGAAAPARSSGAAMNDFLEWCSAIPEVPTQEQLKALPKEDRAAARAWLDTMSKDERKAMRAAFTVNQHRQKMVDNFTATSLRLVAKRCDPDVRLVAEPADKAAFVEMMRTYHIMPILEDLSAIWPVFARLDHSWAAEKGAACG